MTAERNVVNHPTLEGRSLFAPWCSVCQHDDVTFYSRLSTWTAACSRCHSIWKLTHVEHAKAQIR